MLDEPEIVKIKDKDYKVEGFTLLVQQAYQKFMQSKFLELIKSNKHELAEDYLPLLQKHFFDVKCGNYDFGSPNFYIFVNQEDNFLELIYWCFTKYQDISKEELKNWIKEEPELAVALFERLNNTAKKN